MKKIALVNRSKVVTQEQVKAMAEALQTQANDHFAPVWGTETVSVLPFKHMKDAPKDAYQIVLLDKHGDEGDDGYHSTTDSGEPYSKVLVKACLENDGGILVQGDNDDADESGDADDADDTSAADAGDDAGDDEDEVSPDTISATASHELLEMLGDPECDQYRPGPVVKKKYDQYSVEVCDPVQETAYNITLADGKTVVTVSNFLTKSWFESGGAAPFDYLELVDGPFKLAGGGYQSIEDADGNSHDVTDDDDPPAPWRQAARKHPASRSSRRSRA